MNIAFFGSSLVSAYWNGAATYYRGIIRGLHRLGHEVTFYEPDAYDRQKHRDIPDPEWARVVVYPVDGESGVLQALEQARGADMIVKTSGVGAFDQLLVPGLRQIAQRNWVDIADIDLMRRIAYDRRKIAQELGKIGCERRISAQLAQRFRTEAHQIRNVSQRIGNPLDTDS